ncbi:MAG: histidine phosphatase family protein [Candidatus Paceibacterota bacterium]
MKIFIIRHGETTGDIENRYGGNYNDHLSAKGIEQSGLAAKTLSNKGIEVIFSSPLIRAQETAEIIASKINCQMITEDDLKERNQYGILTGMKKEEAKEKYPREVELLKDRLNTIEGAESYEDFSNRIMAVSRKIIEDSNYKTIAIVSHGGLFRVLLRDILKWGELKEIGDCSILELEKVGNNLNYLDASGLVPSFQIPRFE